MFKFGKNFKIQLEFLRLTEKHVVCVLNLGSPVFKKNQLIFSVFVNLGAAQRKFCDIIQTSWVARAIAQLALKQNDFT
jgi:hypothetical protein